MACIAAVDVDDGRRADRTPDHSRGLVIRRDPVGIQISKGNLIAAGLVALLIIPAMFTSCVTHVAPGGIGFTKTLVCPEGSHHMRFHSYRTYSGGRTHEADEAFCVDAGGHDLGGNVYPKSFGIVYGSALVVWGAVLAMVFWPRKKADPPA